MANKLDTQQIEDQEEEKIDELIKTQEETFINEVKEAIEDVKSE